MQPRRFWETYKKVCATGLAVLGSAVTGAAIGLAAGALIGILCGIILAVLHGEWRTVLSAGGYFGLCGAAAGVLVGGFTRLVEACDPLPASPTEGNEGAQSPRSRDLVFQRTGPLADPLIARWNFLEGLASEERARSNHSGSRTISPSLN